MQTRGIVSFGQNEAKDRFTIFAIKISHFLAYSVNLLFGYIEAMPDLV